MKAPSEEIYSTSMQET